jgi:hypothetical protein
MNASTIHNYGTDDGWHGKIEEGGEFPPEKDRYHLYIGTISFQLSSSCAVTISSRLFAYEGDG